MKRGKRKLRLYEIPISYHGRTYEEGKKIGWKDGVKALGRDPLLLADSTIFTSNPTDADSQQSCPAVLSPQYQDWVSRNPSVHILETPGFEFGAGTGQPDRPAHGQEAFGTWRPSEIPLYLHALRNRFPRTPSVDVRVVDPSQTRPITKPMQGKFDERSMCLNLLESPDDPESVIRSATGRLNPGGALVVLVPQGAGLFGSMDRMLGHKRRFAAEEVSAMMVRAGLVPERIHHVNKIGIPAWWFFGSVLGRQKINKLTLKLFDKTVWLWRRVDGLLPWRGLSLIAIGRDQRDPRAQETSTIQARQPDAVSRT